jgi:type VI secretion system protein ImpJ
MFLTPQHFQTQSSFVEDTLQFRFSSSHFANWGVTELRVDQHALTNGQFTVQRCAGVMPDGLVFRMPEADDPPPGRTIGAFFSPSQTSLDVYLAVPELRYRGRNVTQVAKVDTDSPEPEVVTRYVTTDFEVPDENGTEEERTVQLARKNFRILFGGQNLDGYNALRIAQVIRTETGSLALKPDFVAPCLNIATSEHVMIVLRRLIELLATKRGMVAASRKQRGPSLADFNVSDTAHFWLLHTINTFTPALKHFWNTRRGHPEPVFLTLLQLAGALSTFAIDQASLELPDYDHDNLGACFNALDARIRELLETVLPSKIFSIPLREAGRSVWSASITDERFFEESQFLFVISSQISDDEVIRRVPDLVKVAPPSRIQEMIQLALPGIKLTHISNPPGFRFGYHYFTINQGSRLWTEIRAQKSLSVYVPAEIAQPKMELLVVLN